MCIKTLHKDLKYILLHTYYKLDVYMCIHTSTHICVQSVHVCALHIHMYVCMHMCVCVRTLFFKLTTQTTVRISILEKGRKTQ